jgi:hypothetical protein
MRASLCRRVPAHRSCGTRAPPTATLAAPAPIGVVGGSLRGMSEAPQFYFNVRTHQVEELDRKSQSKDLLGPFPTREAAAAALETARARTEQWDEDERRWREGDDT